MINEWMDKLKIGKLAKFNITSTEPWILNWNVTAMNIILTHERQKPFFLSRCLLGMTSLKCCYCKKWKHSLYQPYNSIKRSHIFKLTFFFPLWRPNWMKSLVIAQFVSLNFSCPRPCVPPLFWSHVQCLVWCEGLPSGLQHTHEDSQSISIT